MICDFMRLQARKRPDKGLVRQAFLAEHVLCPPIQYTDMRERVPISEFSVLQGDIIATRDAWVLGSRQWDEQSYLIANSTCDLVPGRRDTVMLLVLEPRRQRDYASPEAYSSEVNNLVVFKSTKYFYLPPLPDDAEDVLFNLVHFDRFAQAASADVIPATRRASLSLIGWRLFGAVHRFIQSREGQGEAEVRKAASAAPDKSTA